MICVDCAPSASGLRTASVRRNESPRCLVASAARRLPRPLYVRRVRDVGGLSRRSLHVRPVPLPLLLSRALRQLTSQLVRLEAGELARVAAVLAGAADPADPRPVPIHVLLLSRRVLQSVLERSAVLHGGRATKELLGRELLPARPAECSPLHAVHLGVRADDPCVRRVEGDVVRRRGARRTSRSASASEPWFSSQMSCCSAGISSAAIRCGMSPEAASISSHARRSDSLRTTASAASTAGTCSGPGPVCSASASQISTSGCVRWACGRISGFFNAGVSDTRT